MAADNQIRQNLAKDQIRLSDDDLQSVIRFLNSLAKIEYEVYRQQKSESKYGNSKEPQDISNNNQKLAA